MGGAVDNRPNWMFIDMDSFFASAEQHLRPALRGQSVGVIPTDSPGTCVIAASLDAKRAGVKVGTRVPEARRLCPGIRLVLARPATYVELHNAIMAEIDRFLPIEKTYSIDEWAIRLRGRERNEAWALETGEAIKDHLRSAFSDAIGCSVGIAPTRLLAKLASGLGKPDGLMALAAGDVPGRVGNEPVTELPGVGNSMAARLARHGIRTVGDLWNIRRSEALEIWGSVVGGRFWDALHGLDEPEIITRRHSMSHANVLEPRFRSHEGARQMLVRLVTRLGRRIRRDGFLASELHVQVRHTDGRGHSASDTLPQVQDTPVLLHCFYRLWERFPLMPAAPKQVSATVGGLTLASQTPAMLFGDEQRNTGLSRIMDAATARWGANSLYFGSMHGCSHPMDEKIAFGRVPQA